MKPLQPRATLTDRITINGCSKWKEPTIVHDFFREKIDLSRFKVQLQMLPDALKTAFAGSSSIKAVTSVRTIAEALNQSEVVKGMLSEVDKVLKAYFSPCLRSVYVARNYSATRPQQSQTG